MAKNKEKSSNSSKAPKKMRPATSMEARENQLISLALNLAEQQLMDGTASSQVITQFLKLGSTKHKLEMEKLQKENELLKAKTEALQSAKDVKALYEDAMNAMKKYSGGVTSSDYGDEDYDEEDIY